jgi:hypothetical protein
MTAFRKDASVNIYPSPYGVDQQALALAYETNDAQ